MLTDGPSAWLAFAILQTPFIKPFVACSQTRYFFLAPSVSMKICAHFHALRLLSPARRICREKNPLSILWSCLLSEIISQDLTKPRSRRSLLPRFSLEIQKGAGERGGQSYLGVLTMTSRLTVESRPQLFKRWIGPSNG